MPGFDQWNLSIIDLVEKYNVLVYEYISRESAYFIVNVADPSMLSQVSLDLSNKNAM